MAEKRAERALEDISSKDPTLARLMRAGRLYAELDRRVQPALSASTRGHVQVACVDNDCLILAARSPAWATRGRLEASQALEAARSVWPRPLNQVTVIVVPGLDAESMPATGK